jgi:site-specific recombinase XerD
MLQERSHASAAPDPVQLVLDSVASPLTKVAYGKSLRDFIDWWTAQGRPPLTKAVVTQHVQALRDRGLASSSINVRLAALRKLVREAADNGLLEHDVAHGIARVPGARRQGRRSGLWLTRAEAQAILLAPDTTTLTGLRDRALLALLIGCGLRRSEAVGLEFSHVQQREGRWVILDLLGKHGRVRTVPMPAWCKAALDDWSNAAVINAGRVLRATTPRGGHLARRPSLSPEAVTVVVARHGEAIGHPALAPHDLRRTFAKLAHTGGAALDQIQLTLGHASLVTTELYLGVDQRLDTAPCDVLGLSLRHSAS